METLEVAPLTSWDLAVSPPSFNHDYLLTYKMPLSYIILVCIGQHY